MSFSSEVDDGNSDKSSVLNLNRVVFIGRTFDEYMNMFNLNPSYLKDFSILDCPSGASSFVAEASTLYKINNVVGCDQLYEVNNSKVLEKKGKEDLEYMVKSLSKVSGFYNWTIYKNINDLYESRKKAFETFISDYKQNETIDSSKHHLRYKHATLPHLPFKDKIFDIVLSSNLLFYYHNMFDYKFHLQSIIELLRVSSKEVRIYPVQRPDAMLPKYLDKLLYDINKNMKREITIDIQDTKHEFRKGVNKVLLLTQ